MLASFDPLHKIGNLNSGSKLLVVVIIINWDIISMAEYYFWGHGSFFWIWSLNPLFKAHGPQFVLISDAKTRHAVTARGCGSGFGISLSSSITGEAGGFGPEVPGETPHRTLATTWGRCLGPIFLDFWGWVHGIDWHSVYHIKHLHTYWKSKANPWEDWTCNSAGIFQIDLLASGFSFTGLISEIICREP